MRLFNPTDAVQHITRVDPVLRRLVRRHGPYQLRPRTSRSPFESLASAIAHQQLNGTAANSILRRFIALVPGRRFPHPTDLPALTDDALRGAGFSRAKVAALRDLAARTLDGTVPSSRAIRKMTDDELIERLTTVRGVGRWTVEMLLIFQLGRPDVLPADDFGVRNGFRRAYRLPELPAPKTVLAHGECWRPHRTAATWYLWRAADTQAEPTVRKPKP